MKKRKIKIGEALVGMNRRGSQLGSFGGVGGQLFREERGGGFCSF